MAISFANRDAGWVSGHIQGGPQAFILRTANGGMSWAKNSVGFDATQMQFINRNDGWAVGFMPTSGSLALDLAFD